MSQIDLKKCTVKFKDGYTGPGGTPRVNLMAGYSTSAVTMVVDGYVGAVANNDLFTVVGSSATHKITAHSETLSNTTSITFTPGLTGAVLDDALVTMLPHELEIVVGEGNATWTEKHAREYKLDRGALNTVRDADQEPLELKLEMTWEFLKSPSGDPPTPIDFLKKRGVAVDYVTAGADACEDYAIIVEITYAPPCEDVEDEVYTFPEFRYEQLDFDLKAGTISMTGKCNVLEPTITRPS